MKHLFQSGGLAASLGLAAAMACGRAGAQETVPLDGPPANRSESSSGQFIVHGDDWRMRGHYCVFAEAVKTEFLRLLQRRASTGYPITINLVKAVGGVSTGDPVKARVSRVENTFRFHVYVEIGDDLKVERVREELIHVLMFEHIVRAAGSVKQKRSTLSIPEWLRIGMAGAIQFRKEMSRRDSVFATIFRSGKLLDVEDILKGRPADATSVTRALYDASACGLVITLLNQPNGAFRLESLMRDLLLFDGTDYALVKKHFPDLENSNNSLEKWWALQVAALAQPTVLDVLTIPETEAALQKALLVSMVEEAAKKKGKRKGLFGIGRTREDDDDAPDGGEMASSEENAGRWYVTYDIVEFEHFARHRHIDRILDANEQKLMLLSYRAFPLYRPIIREYQDILHKLAKGRERGLVERLTDLANLRIALLKTAQDAEDYLHWWEATQTDRESGAFEEYQKLVDKMRLEKRKSRSDPLSKYLDELAEEWD